MIPRWQLMVRFLAVFPIIGMTFGAGWGMIAEAIDSSTTGIQAFLFVAGLMTLLGSLGLVVATLGFFIWRENCRDPDAMVPDPRLSLIDKEDVR